MTRSTKTLLLFFIGVWYPHTNTFADEKGGVHVSIVNEDNGIHRLEGHFNVNASTQAVWNTLSDYDHLNTFVSSIKSSRRTEPDGSGSLVEQTMVGKAGIFHKRIQLTLLINEVAGKEIAFRDISKKSFKHYKGAWVIESMGDEITVRYTLSAAPDFFSPDFIAVPAFKRTVRDLLNEVCAEIIRRQSEQIR